MTEAEIGTSRRARLGVAVLVVALHVVAVLGLIRAFAPDFTAAVTRDVVEAFTVTISPPPAPSPTPTPPPKQAVARPAGAAGEEGRKADPRDAAVPKPKVALARPTEAPAAAASGEDNRAGSGQTGSGTGAGGAGSGTGAGGTGTGSGGGGAKFVQIAGTINSARDYPRGSRDLRLGKSVLIVFTIGTDGRVHNCRVREPSGDPQADAITCRLATERFRFRPSTDAAGNPVEATYGWRQRWFE